MKCNHLKTGIIAAAVLGLTAGMLWLQRLNAADKSLLFNSTEFDGFEWGADITNRPGLDCKKDSKYNKMDCTPQKRLIFLGTEMQTYHYSVNGHKRFNSILMVLSDPGQSKRFLKNLRKRLGEEVLFNSDDKSDTHIWNINDLQVIFRIFSSQAFLEIRYLKFFAESGLVQVSDPYCQRNICDINADSKCDDKDLALFDAAQGRCREAVGWSELMDLDHDGCITQKDRAIAVKYLGKPRLITCEEMLRIRREK